VITSPTGVVWRDISHVLARRWPLARVVLVACQVQGEAAPRSILTAFRRLDRWISVSLAEGRPDDAPQVTILARGGGSLEDLWPFNDESVVRAVVAHAVPVVCGVGHEVDVTLADFAADVRAPTPSAAAEIVVPDRVEFAGSLRRAGSRLNVAVTARVEAARREVSAEGRALDRLEPAARLAAERERAGLLLDRLTRTISGRLATARAAEERAAIGLPGLLASRLRVERAALGSAIAALAVLGPQATLDRGYAIVRRAGDDAVIRDPEEAPAGTGLAVRLARGSLRATVDDG
jgi:exodeoxyribonuclease VII large subunit